MLRSTSTNDFAILGIFLKKNFRSTDITQIGKCDATAAPITRLLITNYRISTVYKVGHELKNTHNNLHLIIRKSGKT